MGCGAVDLIQSTQDWVQCWGLVYIAMDLLVLEKAGNFLIDWAPVCFSRTILIHGVSEPWKLAERWKTHVVFDRPSIGLHFSAKHCTHPQAFSNITIWAPAIPTYTPTRAPGHVPRCHPNNSVTLLYLWPPNINTTINSIPRLPKSHLTCLQNMNSNMKETRQIFVP
jgi:hypothetical protein